MIVILLDSVKNQLNLVAFGGWFFARFFAAEGGTFPSFFCVFVVDIFFKKKNFCSA